MKRTFKKFVKTFPMDYFLRGGEHCENYEVFTEFVHKSLLELKNDKDLKNKQVLSICFCVTSGIPCLTIRLEI